MLRNLLRFEWRYHTHQVTFAAAVLVYAAAGFVIAATGFGPKNLNVNSPWTIAESLGLASLTSVFALAVFCANAVVRDREHEMEEIVFSTPIARRDYLLGRFGGSFLAALTAFSLSIVGLLAGLAMPWQDAARIGPVHLIDYLWPFLVLVVPGMLAAAVTLFAISTLTRSAIASVVGAVAIYVFYFVAAAFTNSPLMAASAPGAGTTLAASLLDPFGLSAFFDQTRHWTPVVRNTRLFSLTGDLLVNRLLWLSYSVVVWLWVSARFSLRVGEGRSRRADVPSPAGLGSDPQLEGCSLPILPAVIAPSTRRAILAATKLELRSHLLSLPFALLTLLWIALAGSEIVAAVATGDYGTMRHPLTGFLLPSIAQPLAIVATVVVVYYSAELVWRERAVGIAEIVSASPASDAVFVCSKLAALSVMVLVLVATGVLSVTGVQIAHGFTRFQPDVMLAFAWFLAVPLLVFAALAIVIQTVSPQKYAGMFAVLAVAVVMQKGDALGLVHPLLRPGWMPRVEYSDMNGFGAFVAPFQWFALLWTFAAAALLLFVTPLWRRATGDRGRGLLRAAAHHTNPGTQRAALACVAGATLTAIFIFYNTNVLNRWMSSEAGLDWSAAYERKYRALAHLPQPSVRAIRGDIALFPRERRVHVRGSYELVNDTNRPIHTVLVTVRPEVRVARLALASAALETYDERFGTLRYRIDPPLPPHAKTRLDFDIDSARRGFEAEEQDTAVAANGSFLSETRVLPSIGYRRGYEIRSPGERKKRGLPPLEADTGGDLDPDAEWVDLDLTLSTDADQRALASGTLAAEWTESGRRFFRYRSSAPLRNVLVFGSARYAVDRTRSGGTNIEIDYHPAHRENVRRIADAAADSLRLFEREFGPYPLDTLRIAEAPSYTSMGGFATPGLIYLSEDRTFLIDARKSGRFDLLRRRTAHEVGHQWWGHQVAPAAGPGASVIVETLAKYCELLVLEEKDGSAAVRDSLARELDLYLIGRTSDERAEVPLAMVMDQSWLYYNKGAVVMNGIRDLLGAPVVRTSLRRFVEEQSGPGHHPSASDLLTALERQATNGQRDLIEQWMRDVVLYDLQVKSAKARALPGGRFEVTLEIVAGKSRVDEKGIELARPFDEAITVALFAGDSSESQALWSGRPRLRAGVNRITAIVAAEPRLAVVDPDVTRVDRSRLDNQRAVEISR